MVGPLAGPTMPGRSWHRDGVKDRLQLGAVVALAAGEDHAQRPATPVAAKMDLGGQPTPGSVKRLGRVMRDSLLRRRVRGACACPPCAGGAARAGGAVDRHLANAWALRRRRGLLYRVRDVYRAAGALICLGRWLHRVPT